ncbi:MAG: RES family NAD+ phosphorylase [Janthinobacterium lividum]
MEIYRICLTRYAGELVASGNPGRWNERGQLVVYAAGSRALACLENVVHRSGEGLHSLFQVLRLEVPAALAVTELTAADLPTGWQQPSAYARCQPLGAAWYRQQATAVLRVPSAIIAHEHNYVLNTRHPDFGQIRIAGREDFVFDSRLKDPDPT